MTLRFDLKLVPDEDPNAKGFWITADVPMGFDLFDLVPLPGHHVMAVRGAYDPRDGGPMHLMGQPLRPSEYQFDASWLRTHSIADDANTIRDHRLNPPPATTCSDTGVEP